ncbi:hypothetical protein [Aliiroseovarius subalbicans]|uniref:hypothetical protein n=1 Tax=Aliiroseovarius subalbicans TaxID=2925840 RepID=UPI001F574165|nr:hypothetical protein [Aliiroseovarius subalbicans]MCI2399521.1 hypothetical protein [Aliiroseovarius subalbicans]
MTNDLFLVIGVVVLALSVPSILGSLIDRRTPRTPAIMVLIGGVLVVLAVTQQPGGYSIQDIPDAFVRVIGRYLR